MERVFFYCPSCNIVELVTMLHDQVTLCNCLSVMDAIADDEVDLAIVDYLTTTPQPTRPLLQRSDVIILHEVTPNA